MGVRFKSRAEQDFCDFVAGQPSSVGIEFDRLIGATPVPDERITDRTICRSEKI